jgi:phage tail P2-like protein
MSSDTYTPLLPANQSTIEGALVHALANSETARTEAAVDLLQTLQRPMEIPSQYLPWLAWDRDVAIWPDWMDESTKRALVRDSRVLHRRAGTVAGLRALARYAGGSLLRVDTPRTRTFCGQSLTLEEREAFLARYPQLRMYRYRNNGIRRGAMFHRLYCGADGEAGSRSADIPLDNGAKQRFGERAWLFEPRNGSEQQLVTWSEMITDVERTSRTVRRVAVPSVAGRVSFVGRTMPSYTVVSNAVTRIYSMQVDDSYVEPTVTLRRTVINPGLDPITPVWRGLAIAGVRRGWHCGQWVGMHSVDSTAGDRLGRYQPLFDPGRTITNRGAMLFVGPQRLRFPPFTAEIKCQISGRRPHQALSQFVRGYCVSMPKSRLRTLQKALSAGIAARDQSLLNTRASRPLTAKQTLLAGAVVAGSFSI